MAATATPFAGYGATCVPVPNKHDQLQNSARWIPINRKNKLKNLNYRLPSPPIAALPFDLSPPPIDNDFLDTVTASGAKVSEEGIIETFDNDDEALDAFDNGVAGCETVFVTPTARTIDIAHAWIMKNAIMLVVSPTMSGSIANMLNKYIFFADKVEIQDITKQTCFFILVGPKSNQLIRNLDLGDLVGQPFGTHRHYSVNGMPVTVAVGNIISEKGFSLLMSPAVAGTVWKTLLSQRAIPLGSYAWEKLRIIQGRPAPGKELTNEFNVLEAGLWNSISLDKGCYKGQETISRLITYDGVKQRLWGLHLSASAQPGSSIFVDGRKVGKLTSYTSGRKDSEHFGLGYVKRQAATSGDTVVVGDNIMGKVVEVPFLARQCPPSKAQSQT